MTHTSKKPEGMSGKEKGVAVGVGIAALAAALAGSYYLYGSKNAEKHRKQVKSWALKARGEILEKLESLSEVNEEIYHRIVQEVTDRYEKLKTIDSLEIESFKNELRNYWDKIKTDMKIALVEKATKTAHSTAEKTAVKKSAKSAKSKKK